MDWKQYFKYKHSYFKRSDTVSLVQMSSVYIKMV